MNPAEQSMLNSVVYDLKEQAALHPGLGSLRIGMDEVRLILTALALTQARVAQVEAERDGWLPIETAPRGRKPFLVFAPYDQRFSPGEAGLIAIYPEMGSNLLLAATHWRPLPAPPEAGS